MDTRQGEKTNVVKKICILLLDAVFIALGIVLGVLLRYGDSAYNWQLLRVVRFSPVVIAVDLIVMALLGAYNVRWRYADMRDMLRIIVAFGIATGVNLLLNRVFHARSPRLVISLDGIISMLMIVFSRYSWILIQDRLLTDKAQKHVRRALIIGAEDAMVARKLTEADSSVRRVAVGCLDEDVEKLYRRVGGLTVEGTLADIQQVVKRKHADEVILVKRDYPANLLRHVYHCARREGLKVLVAADGKLREAKIEDILAGWTASPLSAENRAYFAGKRFLVIGTGSVGTEITRQLAELQPESVTVIDSSEDALVKDLPEITRIRLADVRDMDRIEKIMRAARPDIVFHSAALTRRETAEGNCLALAGVNVLGAEYMWKMAKDCGAKAFAFMSDACAFAPEDEVQMSRALGERAILTRVSSEDEMKTLIVRLGNVVTSRGGVLARLHASARRGENISVGYNETVSFLSASDAARYALALTASEESGVYMIDPEDPVDMTELTRAIVSDSGYNVEVLISGDGNEEALAAQKIRETSVRHAFSARGSALDAQTLDEAVGKLLRAVASDDEESAENALKPLRHKPFHGGKA